MIKILFTGGGGAGNEALFRLLGNVYELHFGDADVNAIDPIVPKGHRHELPWASDPEFVRKISELCRRLEIDILVPGVDEELLTLAKNADALEPTRLLLPGESFVETMLDKLTMIKALANKEIPVPQTQTLDDDLMGVRFPCIAKPRKGRGSRGVSVLSSFDEAVALKKKLGSLAAEMLVQEKIEGVEYTVQMVADARGILRAIVPVKVGIKRGITLRAETDDEPRVISACQALHHALPTAGCYNVQLIRTAEGDVLPFEINPRISTTLCLTVAAGIDPIKIFLENAEGSSLLQFKASTQLRRHWKNHFLG